MSDNDQITAFEVELDKLVDRFREEFDLTTAGAIGVLYLKIHALATPDPDDGDT